jgi:hypothetical protein
MRSNVERDTGARSSLAGIQFLPAIASRAKSRYVLEVHRKRSRAISSDKTDSNAVAQGSGPVRVELTGDRCGGSGWPEGGGSFAEGVLADGNDVLRGVS